jgi:hypothetical protein
MALGVWNASAFQYMVADPISFNWRRGWPVTYLTQIAQRPTADALWSFTQHVRLFRPLMLLFDVVAAICVALLVAYAFEWRRRRRPRLVSIGLKEFFVLSALIAIGLAYWFHLRAEHRKMQAIIDSLGGPQVLFGVDQMLPVWVRSWQMRGELLLGDLPTAIQLTKVDNPAAAWEGLARLNSVRNLTIDGDSKITGGSKITIDAHAWHLQKMRQLESLSLRDTDLSDEGASILAVLKQLRILALDNCISNAGVRHIAGLTNLELLTIMGSRNKGPRITGACFMHFSDLTNLKTLSIVAEKASANEITQLARLRNLEWLQLLGGFENAGLESVGKLTRLRFLLFTSHQPVTDDDIAHLRNLNQLTQLHLGNTQIGDAALEMISTMHLLQKLSIDKMPNITDVGMGRSRNQELPGAQITEVGIRNLRNLPNLKSLGLNGAAITDESLTVLEKFPHLEELSVRRTSVSDEAVRSLQQRRPNLKVYK